MLDVRKLATLREVSSCGSFSAAAHRLNYSQSAISQQVAQLEREVGTLLIERRARGVRLTQAGRLLVDHTGIVLHQLAAAEAELEAVTGQRHSPIRLVAFGSAAATIAPPAIVRLRERHPEIAFTMTIADSSTALAQVANGEADAAIINRGRARLRDSAITHLDLLSDPLHVALPLSHPCSNKSKLSLAELATEPWMLAAGPACADSEMFQASCRLAGFEPQIAFRNDDYMALQGLVAAGLGVALIPALAAVTVRHDIVVRPLCPRAPVRKVAAIVPTGTICSPTISSLLQELRTTAAALMPQLDASSGVVGNGHR